MFTNEFGQTVKGDWVAITTTPEELTVLGTTIVRAIVRGSHVGVAIDPHGEDPMLHSTLTGVTVESEAQKLQESLGIEIRLFAEDEEYDVNDSHGLTSRILALIFGDKTSYAFDNEGKVIIKINFDEYIRRTHGL